MNTGIPITPKPKDVMHEIVYMTHDVCHQAIFDPLFVGDGIQAGLNIQQESALYIICRWMSEMMTLPLGDMVFVDAALEDGLSYETVLERKIMPLYRSKFGEQGIQNVADLKLLLRSSYRFGIAARPDAFGDPDDPAFKSFFDKYASYATADLRWSQQNARFIEEHLPQYRAWHHKHRSLLSKLGLLTVGEIWRGMDAHHNRVIRHKEAVDIESTSDLVFEWMVERLLHVLKPKEDVKLDPWEMRQKLGFQR